MDYQLEQSIKNGFSTYRKTNPNSISNRNTLKGMILSDSAVQKSIFSEDLPEITSLEDLLKWLTSLLIRFDTSPSDYQKSDYKVLISILVKSLIYLYKQSALKVDSNDYNSKLSSIFDQLQQHNVDIDDIKKILSEYVIDIGDKIDEVSDKLQKLSDKHDLLENNLVEIIQDTFQEEINTKKIPLKSVDFENGIFNINCGTSTELT